MGKLVWTAMKAAITIGIKICHVFILKWHWLIICFYRGVKLLTHDVTQPEVNGEEISKWMEDSVVVCGRDWRYTCRGVARTKWLIVTIKVKYYFSNEPW
jgi:hypothetical protein